MSKIDIHKAEYGDIIKFAESHGYKRSAEAVKRESEATWSIGQYGLTLDEAIAYIRRLGLMEET